MGRRQTGGHGLGDPWRGSCRERHEGRDEHRERGNNMGGEAREEMRWRWSPAGRRRVLVEGDAAGLRTAAAAWVADGH